MFDQSTPEETNGLTPQQESFCNEHRKDLHVISKPEERMPEEIAMPLLEPRQQRFCLEYLKDLNATAAARRAGYSIVAAQSTGSRILALPHAQEFIRKEKEKLNSKLLHAAEVANNELVEMAFMNRGDFMDDRGNLVNPKELPEEMRGAIQIHTRRIQKGEEVTIITDLSLFNKIQMMQNLSKKVEIKPHKKEEPRRNLALMEDGTEEEI